VTIIAFRTDSEYQAYATRAFASAYYAGDQDADFIVLSNAGHQSLPVAVHEYMHLLIRHSGLHLPVWLNEGIAEVYSTLRQSGSKTLVGTPPENRLQLLRRESWMPLARVLAVTEDAPEYNEKLRANVFYAQSWLLTHMLMLDENMSPGFTRFINLIEQGVPAAAAFDRVWSLSPAQVQDRLRLYAESPLNGLSFDIAFGKTRGIEPRPASAVEVDVALATLSSLLDRSDDALTRLRSAVAREPGNARAHEALAAAAWRRSDLDLARAHFRRATELNTSNWRTWRDYARLLLGLPGTGPAIIAALGRALELNPGHAETRLMLAEELEYAKQHEKAIATVEGIGGEFAPQASLIAALALLELGRRTEAQLLAENVLAAAADPTQRRRAAAILQRVSTPDPEAGPVAPRERTKIASGVFKELECAGASAVIHLVTANGPLRLRLHDAASASMKGTDGATISCGQQPARTRVSVEYLPLAAAGADGEVRTVEYLERPE
jgi:tetratricopeptide (TPR) repeat protein